MFSRCLFCLLVFSGLCWQTVTPSSAAVIVENNAGTTVSLFGGIFAQSVTTPTGGPWGNIRFNFVNGADSPIASGGLYALSQQYSGRPDALSTSTPGFLGFTNVISGGQWQFSGLTLNPSTQYFFYMDNFTNDVVKFSQTNSYAEGAGFNAVAPTTNYLSIANFDLNLSLQGDVVAVPEPSSVLFVGLAVGGLGLRRWQVRGRKSAAALC